MIWRCELNKKSRFAFLCTELWTKIFEKFIFVLFLPVLWQNVDFVYDLFECFETKWRHNSFDLLRSCFPSSVLVSSLKNVKKEIFHDRKIFYSDKFCLQFRSSGSCPHCRHSNIQHFQLFFVLENNDDESDGEVAGAIRPANSHDSNLSKQVNEIS